MNLKSLFNIKYNKNLTEEWSVTYKGQDYPCNDEDHARNKARKLLNHGGEHAVIKKNGSPVFRWSIGKHIEPIKEDLSLKNTLQAVESAVGQPIVNLFAELSKRAKEYRNQPKRVEKINPEKGPRSPMDGWPMLAGGITSKWMEVYFKQFGRDQKLQGHLKDLAAKTKSMELVEFLDTMPTKFSEINKALPNILISIANKVKSERLRSNAEIWKRKYMEYAALLDQLKQDDDDDDFEPVASPVVYKKPEVGQQMAQAEEMVNHVLRNLPSKVAGEIRNAIARNPNKLHALQQELNRRNIKLSESKLIPLTESIELAMAGAITKLINLK